jgi:nucleotidyltransferase substrate binding protein (TIGR01987 family)
MEILITQQQVIKQSLETLSKSLKLIHDPCYQMLYEELRDSVIKRFEYSIDTFWKYLRVYLEIVHKVVIGPVISPKAVFRAALNIQFITQEEFEDLLLVIDDRNLTSHTYNEELAEAISKRIENYYILINSLVERTA